VIKAAVSGMFLVCGVLAGCEVDQKSVSLGENLRYESAREAIDARVEADGIFFTTPLEVLNHKDERMQVLVYGDNGALLGYAEAKPTYEDSVWDKFKIFVPYYKLAGMTPGSGFDVYVIAPNDPSHYVEHERFGQSNLSPPDILWTWLSYEDDAAMPGGGRGLRVTFSLRISGYQGQTLQTYALVRDLQLREIKADLGGPFRIEGESIRPGFTTTSYDKLVFDIPYDRLAGVPAWWRLEVTPAVLVGEHWVTGNIHVQTWAGGTADEVRRKVEEIAGDYDRRAEALQQQIDQLRREVAQ
jgi:hypothetical protein